MRTLGLIACVAAAVIAIAAAAWAVNSREERLGLVVGKVLLQAIERGYMCRVNGRSLEDCQNEQRERWRKTSQ